MKLKDLYNRQREFNNIVWDKNPLLSKEDIIKNLMIALFTETGEFSNELSNFKHWKTKHVVNRHDLLLEYADILLIWASLGEMLGFDCEEVEEVINAKIYINNSRQENGY